MASFAVAGCACERKAPPPERTEPWLRDSAPTKAPEGPPVIFVTEPSSQVRFAARTRAAAPAGVFRVVKGRLTVPLGDLANVRGDVSVDLMALAMQGDSAEEEASRTNQGRGWLGVGTSLPEAQIERQRWATFAIAKIEALSANAAERGTLVKTPLREQDAATDAALLDSGDVRRVTFTVTGDLSLNSIRAPLSVPVVADFYYEGKAGNGKAPARILVHTPRAMSVPLETHNIVPRSATGVLVATDMKLLGTSVGKVASVTFEIGFTPELPVANPVGEAQ